MDNIPFEALGFTPEQLQDRVVEHVAKCLLTTTRLDSENDDEFLASSEWREGIEKRVRELIEQKVEQIATEHVLPKVASMVENLELKPTNRWGEPKGEPVSFVEHMVERAENWMTEKVDFQGKKPDYHSKGTQTRVAHMVHQHLHYTIEKACKGALDDLNGKVATGIADTVKLKLKEALERLTVKAGTR